MGLHAYTTISEFVGKIDYEGGIDEALAYGLKSVDLAPEAHHEEFKSDWDRLARLYGDWAQEREIFVNKHLEGRQGW